MSELGNGKNFAIGLGSVIVIIAVVVGIVVAVNNSGETKTVDQNETTSTQTKKNSDYTEEEVLDLVQNYRGKDNAGQTLVQVMAMLITVAYSDEDILKNPSTTAYFSALPMLGDPDIDRRWNVEFYFKSYRETVSYQWAVDTETGSIYARNENGKDILDVLDAFE